MGIRQRTGQDVAAGPGGVSRQRQASAAWPCHRPGRARRSRARAGTRPTARGCPRSRSCPGHTGPDGGLRAAGPWPDRWPPAPARSKPSPVGPRRLLPAGRHAAGQPARGELGGGRKRGAIQPRDRPQHGVFHLTGHHGVKLAQPRPLAVPARPYADRIAQVMQLNPATTGTGPHVGQGAAQLGVPHQRRQILDDNRHAHMIDRAVGRHLDRAVGHGVPAEQPHITGAGQIHCLIQADIHGRHGLT